MTRYRCAWYLRAALKVRRGISRILQPNSSLDRVRPAAIMVVSWHVHAGRLMLPIRAKTSANHGRDDSEVAAWAFCRNASLTPLRRMQRVSAIGESQPCRGAVSHHQTSTERLINGALVEGWSVTCQSTRPANPHPTFCVQRAPEIRHGYQRRGSRTGRACEEGTKE